MNILLLTNYSGAWPYIPELVRELRVCGINVDILDVGDLVLLGANSAPKHLITPALKILNHSPFIRVVLRYLAVRSFTRILSRPYDVLNVHYVSPDYAFLKQYFKKLANRTILSVWGSDFYRVSNAIRRRERGLYTSADAITFINPKTRQDFIDYYERFSDTAVVVKFGLGSMEIMKYLQSHESVQESRAKLGIPPDAFVIACGYNAQTAQQHQKIFESIVSIRHKLPQNSHFIFPMTYPDNKTYVRRIEQLVQASGIGYTIFNTMLTSEDTARIRLSTNIAVNMQTTDQLAASIQEHLFAGSVVIVAEWLPYTIYQELGITYFKVPDFKDLGEKLVVCCNNYEELHMHCLKNKQLVFDFASWKNNIESWLSLYRSQVDHHSPSRTDS